MDSVIWQWLVAGIQQSDFPRSQLFKVLKRELTAHGYWRNKPRGNPSKGYARMKEVKT